MTEPVVFVVPIIAGALVLVGGVVYATRKAERRRTAALADVALRLGFAYLAEIPEEQLAALGAFHLFKRGHSRHARSVMRGKSGDAEIVLMDYQYTTGGGKDSHTYRQTVAVYPGASRSLPEFTLAPEHFWHKIGGLLGYQDIDFEASEAFSKQYLLRGPDETAIRAAFGAEPLGFFAQSPGWSVESQGGALAIYRSAKRCKPEEIQPFVAEVDAVRRALART
jgi:hypothetical protein